MLSKHLTTFRKKRLQEISLDPIYQTRGCLRRQPKPCWLPWKFGITKGWAGSDRKKTLRWNRRSVFLFVIFQQKERNSEKYGKKHRSMLLLGQVHLLLVDKMGETLNLDVASGCFRVPIFVPKKVVGLRKIWGKLNLKVVEM